MSNPSHWKAFCKWRRQHEALGLPEHVSLSDLNRFAARYRLARAFNGIEATGYAKDTLAGYGSVMRAFLAYSALEQFHKAVRPTVGRPHLMQRWADMAIAPAENLRDADDVIRFLIKTVSHEKLKNKLIAFHKGETDNSLIVATALRHTVAHGFMSVHPDGTSPKISKTFCEQLTRMLLSIADRSFIELLESLSVDFGPAE
ncbi:MAG: hypothetical protein WA885_23985 [Phormidesmis sp.]